MMEYALAAIWALLGLWGGCRLNKTGDIDPLAWPMAALLGPVTLALSLWERPL